MTRNEYIANTAALMTAHSIPPGFTSVMRPQYAIKEATKLAFALEDERLAPWDNATGLTHRGQGDNPGC